jgi:hypothetical protein
MRPITIARAEASIGAAVRLAASCVKAAIAELRHVFVEQPFDSYRPERHYMRGPGPKWHAKHSASPVLRATAENERPQPR